MFPIRDDITTRSKPYLTLVLIAINTGIFLFQTTRPGDGANLITWKYGFIPAKFVLPETEFEAGLQRHPPPKQITDQFGRPLFDRRTGQPAMTVDVDAFKGAIELPASVNIFTGMFLHGGWMHLIGNMLFLWIFGNNVEDRLGRVLFIIFYLAAGVCGNLLHTFMEPGFTPLVGASGAISGVMGGYLILYPRARILAIVPIGWYPATFSLPAWVYLAFYFVLQNVFPALGGADSHVAFWAHIGGFISGIILILILPKRPHPGPQKVYDPAADDADFVL